MRDPYEMVEYVFNRNIAAEYQTMGFAHIRILPLEFLTLFKSTSASSAFAPRSTEFNHEFEQIAQIFSQTLLIQKTETTAPLRAAMHVALNFSENEPYLQLLMEDVQRSDLRRITEFVSDLEEQELNCMLIKQSIDTLLSTAR